MMRASPQIQGLEPDAYVGVNDPVVGKHLIVGLVAQAYEVEDTIDGMLTHPLLYAVGQLLATVLLFKVLIPAVPTTHSEYDFASVFLQVAEIVVHLLVESLDMGADGTF